jgi:hypothetical protein
MKIPKEMLDRLAAVERGAVDNSPLVLFSPPGEDLPREEERRATLAEAQGRLVVVIDRFGGAQA